MKNTNTAKKQTSPQSGTHSSVKVANSHIKIVKPRPTGNDENSIQGPRDCFPLG